MKQISAVIGQMSQADIAAIETQGSFEIAVENEKIALAPEDVEILSVNIPGWLGASAGAITVALDINVTEDLRLEGIARELINRIQNIRKDSDFEVTDKVNIQIEKHDLIVNAIQVHSEYIKNQTLTAKLLVVETISASNSKEIEIDEQTITILVEKNV